MLKYIIVFTIFYLQIFILSFPAKSGHLQNPMPKDFVMYKSFCVDEDAILRVGQALEISKQKADFIFFSLSMSERCFEHSEKEPGLIVKDIHTFKSIYGLDAIVYQIQTSSEETGYILFMSAAHVGV